MSEIFADEGFRVVQLPNSQVEAALLVIDGFPAMPILVTQYTFGHKASASFMESAGEAVYGMAFGESMADLQVSGSIIDNVCAVAQEGGYARLQNYYYSTNMVATPTPVKLVIGGVAYNGFLLSLGQSARGSGIGVFTINFKVMRIGAGSARGFPASSADAPSLSGAGVGTTTASASTPSGTVTTTGGVSDDLVDVSTGRPLSDSWDSRLAAVNPMTDWSAVAVEDLQS